MTPQQRADEYLMIWQALRAQGLTPRQRNDKIDDMLAEARFFRAYGQITTDIGAIRCANHAGATTP